ncbi:MAG: HAMP domain-containing protein [Calditrichaeota bacterium]|nr:HAMP domain-containing protein [Calditrichota bacterium]
MPRFELRTRLFVMSEVLVLTMAVFASLYFGYYQSKRAEADIDHLAETVARGLAMQAKVGMLVADTEEMNKALSVVYHGEVRYAGLAAPDGTIIQSIGELPSDRKRVHVPSGIVLKDAKLGNGERVREVRVPVYAEVEGKPTAVGTAFLGVSLQQLQQVKADAVRAALFVALVFSLLGLGIAYYASYNIVRPVEKLTKAAMSLADGDTSAEIEIDRSDEIGDLARAFRKMREAVESALAEAEARRREAEEAKAQAEQARNAVIAHHRELEGEIAKVLAAVDEMASGDLRVRIDLESDSDLSELAQRINAMQDALKTVLSETKKVGDELGRTAEEIGSATDDLAEASERQLQQIDEIVGSVAEMSRTIRETARYSQEVARESQHSKEVATKGSERVADIYSGVEEIVNSQEIVAATISNLVSQVGTIGEIANAIEEIADQTNLLALNAAIEAARAGEQGRGFAVVADEVGKLADRTTQATKEIAQVIRAIQQRTSETDQSVNRAREVVERVTRVAEDMQRAMSEIVGSAETVNEMISHVAVTAEEQSAAAEQINGNVELIRSAAARTAGGTQEIARVADNLEELTRRLDRLMRQFRLDGESGEPTVVERFAAMEAKPQPAEA